ncbi:MAG: GNAT family N-acetyltransferase [Methanotrichaceae archaeon]|nr:GNAT family N-acetyltransferase [Methanotrichaceae archaeon]
MRTYGTPSSGPLDAITIRTEIKPGDLGCITYLHGMLYSLEYGFDSTFEPYVAAPLCEFALSQNREGQRIWIAEMGGRIVGCVAIVRHSSEVAQLRWLLVSPRARDLGLGGMLVSRSLDFCRERGYRSVFLWTVSFLLTAKAIYRSLGFHKTEEKTHFLWGRMLTEERYELEL